MPQIPLFAVIGGSGLYAIPDLSEVEEHNISTPYGEPSAPILVGMLEGQPIAFLARHGIGHHISPTKVNYRANIYALKKLGVEQVISVNACGSLREDYKPGDIVIPNQLFDFTKKRDNTFFEDDLVAHIGSAEPFCARLSARVLEEVQTTGATVHPQGAFITIEGPRFSTRLESNTFRAWGMDIVGMTTSPEAFLAREAELCYAVVAHITDYDVWHKSEKPVTVEMVIKILNKNTKFIKEVICNLAKNSPGERTCPCSSELKDTLITNPSVISAETRQKLAPLIAKYL